jgi:hypothetical protein
MVMFVGHVHDVTKSGGFRGKKIFPVLDQEIAKTRTHLISPPLPDTHRTLEPLYSQLLAPPVGELHPFLFFYFLLLHKVEPKNTQQKRIFEKIPYRVFHPFAGSRGSRRNEVSAANN